MTTNWTYLRRNLQLAIGFGILAAMLLFWLIGYLTVDPSDATPLSAMPDLPPSGEYLFGTDTAGRQLLPVMIVGAPKTLEIGLIAGAIGLIVGTILGFTAGYFGGLTDTIIRGVADVFLTVPALAVLVVIASVISQVLTPEVMALIIASLAWMWPTRTIRSQVLTMRERAYVEVARLSGLNSMEIIFKEMMPNLLPYLAASFVGAVAAAVLAAIGLEALGLGPQSEPTLGMTIFWSIYYGALLRGMWWWWGPPVMVIILLFISLFMISAGLDAVANPRTRRGLMPEIRVIDSLNTQNLTDDILQVKNLSVNYHTDTGPVQAVQGISFGLKPGERLGLVGESGSGKSTTVLALLRMIKPPGRIETGSVLLNNDNLLNFSEEQMQAARFARISLIPQGAMNSLNPVMRVKHQIGDTIKYHNGSLSKQRMSQRIGDLLESVGLERSVANMYPHELSGGMKQRVCIAMGISLQPEVIIADEPTSALDVVVQRQVMETLGNVQEEIGASLILVGHDMGLMAQFVNIIGVMYAGRLVEVGPVDEIFENPQHPYTQLLIASIPSLEGKGVFKGIPGITPSLLDPPPGCAFHPRCPQVMDVCKLHIPDIQDVRRDWRVACHLY